MILSETLSNEGFGEFGGFAEFATRYTFRNHAFTGLPVNHFLQTWHYVGNSRNPPNSPPTHCRTQPHRLSDPAIFPRATSTLLQTT
jgi:hypothetical protein